VHFGYHDNDRRLFESGVQQQTEILNAAGALEAWSVARTAHLMGGCRMGKDAENSVVDADCRAHDVPNLFVCDGSVFPTTTAVNPSLTIQAVAARAADRIAAIARRGELKATHS